MEIMFRGGQKFVDKSMFYISSYWENEPFLEIRAFETLANICLVREV
jgi:hypothetical protein